MKPPSHPSLSVGALAMPSSADPGVIDCEVSYRLEPVEIPAILAEAYRPAWGAAHWGRWERLRLVLGGASLGVLVFMLIGLYVGRLGGIGEMVWDQAAGALLGGAFLGWILGGKRMQPPAAGSPILQMRTARVDASGFGMRIAGYDTRVDWRHIAELRRSNDFLLLTTALGELHAIPVRAFADGRTADAFLAEAVALRRAAIFHERDEPLHRYRYRLTRGDVRAFFALKPNGDGWRGALFYLLVLPMLGVTVNLCREADDAIWWSAVAASVVAAWALSRSILWLDRRHAISRYPLPTGEIELQHWDDHLILLTDEGEEILPRERIVKVVVTATHLFLITAPGRAVIVPAWAFPDGAAMASFAAAIERAVE